MFRKLLSIEEAKIALERSFSPKPVGVEQIPLSEAHNRVLAEDVVAPVDVPPFDRATVDGYAVKATDTFDADEDRPVSLRLCGRVSVGEPPNIVVEKGTTAEIATGAPLPQGADAVVMMEYAAQRSGAIFIYGPVSEGENVMGAGSDIQRGEVILREGQTLTPRNIGVTAALGLTQVSVYKRPKVAVISTGAEIVGPGKPLTPGKIYDINTYSLSTAVSECGGNPIVLGTIPDETDQLKSALEEALGLADVIVTSGGVSVGPTDVIPQVLGALGEPGVIVCGIASKPGKPTTIAIIDGKPVFSLPGHPTSSLLMFYMFVRPVIRNMAGGREETSATVSAIIASKVFPARGRRTFVMVNLAHDRSGRLIASPVPLGLSGAITTLARADGFVEIRESQQFINAGDKVVVHLFKPTSYVGLLTE